MTTGLLTQLADYGAYHDEEQGNVEVADILAAVGSPADRGSQSGDRRLGADEQRGEASTVEALWEDVERPAPSETGRWSGVAIAVAATILVVIGVVVVASRPESNTVVASPHRDVEVLPFLAGLKSPNDVVFDPTGGLFVSEHHAAEVGRVEILADGSAGERVVVASYFQDLERLALDDNGVLYFNNNMAVIRVSNGSAKTFTTENWATLTSRGGGDPEGLAIDANGNVYVAHNSEDAESGSRITRIDLLDDGSAGTETEIAILPGGWSGDIEFSPAGELFAPNDRDEIWAITINDDGSMTSLRLFARVPGGPNGLAFDASGTLYVGTDSGSVWSVDPTGEPTIVTTGLGSVASLAFDASGTLYLADVETGEVLRVVAN